MERERLAERAVVRVVALALSMACFASSAAALGSSCTTAADCPLPGAPCELCADGTVACPIVTCVANQCQYQLQACPGVCGAGLSWCSLDGRCVAPQCLSCCFFGTSCAVAADCGEACVTCSDGSSACSAGECGTNLADQCFFPEPVCPVPPKPVPDMPTGLSLVLAGIVGALGIWRAQARRRPAQ